MPEPIVAAGSNRLLSWRPASFATMRRSKGGMARSNNPPKSALIPFGSYLSGGMPGFGGRPEGGRDGDVLRLLFSVGAINYQKKPEGYSTEG